MPVHRHPIAAAPATLLPLPMDKALVARLRATYDAVRRHDLHLAHVFYAKLFAAAPGLRPLFRDDPASQASKLLAALDAVVANLENPQANAALLADLGRRHATYGARPEHYTLVVTLLIDAMREVLGPAAEETALEEWRLALTLVSRHMIAAAEPARP